MRPHRLLVASFAVLLVGIALEPAPARAPHSFAMFDTANPITLTGIVTGFEWTNPHVYIELDVPEASGVKHWKIELGSPSIRAARSPRRSSHVPPPVRAIETVSRGDRGSTGMCACAMCSAGADLRSTPTRIA